MTEDDPSGSTAARRSIPAPRGTAADAPAVRLPALHFAAGAVFLAAGGAALAWAAPSLAAGSFSDTRVIGAFHLLTLGWIGTAIMGASMQLLPVALGARLRWEGMGYASFAAWAAGTAAFAGGMLAVSPTAYVAGAGALGAGAVLFVANLWATLPRAPARGLPWWCLAASGLFLVAGWLLGLLLAVNLTAGILGATRYSVLSVHVHLVAGGWVLLTMIGVGHVLLPRFLGSRGGSPVLMRAAAGFTGLGAALLLASEHLLPVGVIRIGLWLMVIGAALFAAAGLLYFGKGRRAADPAMSLVATGLVCLALAAGTGAWLLTGGPPRASVVTAYGLLLVPGGFALFVAGMASRIVPFLARLHGVEGGEAGSEGGKADRRGPSEAPGAGPDGGARLAGAGAFLLTLGAPVLAAGALFDSGFLAGAGGVCYAAGALVVGGRLLGPAWRLVDAGGGGLQPPPSRSS